MSAVEGNAPEPADGRVEGVLHLAESVGDDGEVEETGGVDVVE